MCMDFHTHTHTHSLKAQVEPCPTHYVSRPRSGVGARAARIDRRRFADGWRSQWRLIRGRRPAEEHARRERSCDTEWGANRCWGRSHAAPALPCSVVGHGRAPFLCQAQGSGSAELGSIRAALRNRFHVDYTPILTHPRHESLVFALRQHNSRNTIWWHVSRTNSQHGPYLMAYFFLHRLPV